MVLQNCRLTISTLIGAFLLGKDDLLFKEEEEHRISFFQSHHHSVETLECAEEVATNHSVFSVILRLLHQIGVDVGGDSQSGVAWAEQEFSASCFNVIRKRICARFAILAKSERLVWLVKMRRELQPRENDSVWKNVRDLASQLDEIIVLTEEADKLQEASFTNDLSQIVSEWVYKASIVGAAVQARQVDDSNRFSPAATATSTMGAIAPQVRRQLTEAMLHPFSTVDSSDLNAVAPCMLFSLMLDRVVISREECFETFVKSFKGNSSLEDLCSAFAFGMHQLCHCGLVIEKFGSKNNVLYERTALVWCSGN